MKNPPTISLETAQLPNNILRADIYVKNAPDNFLGLAFELNIEGQKWDFQKYELGSIFRKPSELLVLATQRSEPASRIVFGLSYKGKTVINKEKTTPDDGKMVSFYIQTPTADPLKFSFSQNIISVYEKGRKNLENVVWTNKEVYLKPFIQQSLSKKEPAVTQKIVQPAKKTDEKLINQAAQNHETIVFDKAPPTMEKTLEPMTMTETLSTNTFQSDQSLVQIYLALGTIFILFIAMFLIKAVVSMFKKTKT